jgi:hypothetical protein
MIILSMMSMATLANGIIVIQIVVDMLIYTPQNLKPQIHAVYVNKMMDNGLDGAM